MTALPDGYAETPEGLLFLADGVSPPRRWDGIAPSLNLVGVAAPTQAPAAARNAAAADPGPARPATACVLAKDGAAVPAGDPGSATPIVGTYVAYVRYMDQNGVYSTLSPISNALTLAAADAAFGLVYTSVPVPPAGIVRRQILRNQAGNTNALFVDVDTTDLVGTTFKTTLQDAALGRGPSALAANSNKTPGIVGTYYAYVRFVNELGAVSDLSPISGPLVLSPGDFAYGVTYSNVAVPTQANVRRRQILRNTSGQADVFYVDVDTADLTSTTFSSTRFDTALSSGVAVPIFDTNNNALANSHGMPPTHKCVMAHHLGRMFLAVDAHVTGGGVAVTSGSALVAGLNTAWTSSLAGRFLWVRGASAPYQIASVDPAGQTLTLAAPYPDATNPYADYGIRPAAAERRLVYYSQGGQVESWPAVNALSIQEDGDELTGLMVRGSFLYVIELRHVYRFTFQTDPATDGFVFLSSNRGAVNNRCWVVAEDTVYMLDYAGIHAFDGTDSKSVSDPIQHLWRAEQSGPKINWSGKDLFFAVHSQDEQYVRWFVDLSGEGYPRHSIAFDYRAGRFWVEEYDRPITAGCAGGFDSRRRVYLGGEANATYLGWQQTLEAIDPSAGVTRGSVTSSSARRLSDAQAGSGWPQDLVGRSVTIVSGRGAGQRRTIQAASGGTLTLTRDWQVKPDATSVYQLGGVSWVWQSGWLRLVREEADNARRVEVVFDPTARPATMAMRLYRDFSPAPVVWRTTRRARDNEGFATAAGQPAMLADLNVPRGFAQARTDGHKEANVEGARFLSVELAGVSSADEQAVLQVVIDGVQGVPG